MTPEELEVMRELDCPEKSWGDRKPQKKKASCDGARETMDEEV